MLGLLLAIGPLFVGLLLFESTKGFFEGWLRTALGFALVPLATVVFMAGLLASLEPSLQGLAVARAENRYDLQPILTVMVIILTFTAVFGSVIGLCTRLVAGFRLPDVKSREPEPVLFNEVSTGNQGFGPDTPAEASRASRLAAVVSGGASGSGSDRRDARLAAAVSGAGAQSSTTFDRRTELVAGGGTDGVRGDYSVRLGQNGRKRNNPTRPSRPRESMFAQPPSKLSLSATGKAP
jgi:type IV secretion system protein VirB6